MFGRRVRTFAEHAKLPTAERQIMSRPIPQVQPIEREEHPSKGRYVFRLGGDEAEMTYSRAGESMIIIDHTEVPDAMRGRLVGQTLVRRAVEDARAEGRSIVPLCPFAKAQLLRHPDWHDVLKR
nr:hypothetical protein [uncultured bacterium]